MKTRDMWVESLEEVLLARRPEWRDGGHDEIIQRGEKKRCIHAKEIQYYSTIVRSRPACVVISAKLRSYYIEDSNSVRQPVNFRSSC